MNIKKVAAVLAPVATFILVVTLLFAFMERTPEVYADGELIDTSCLRELLYEEEGEVFQVGWRLVKLAGGENLSADQQRQMGWLVGGLCEEIRGLGMDIEMLQARVEVLWTLAQEQTN